MTTTLRAVPRGRPPVNDDDDDDDACASSDREEGGVAGVASQAVPLRKLLRRRYVGALTLLCVLSTALVGRFLLSESLTVDSSALESSPPSCVVRVNTFRRNDLLSKFAAHYERCEAVAEITVVWSDQENDPPKWLLHKKKKIRVERHTFDSLNNRFRPLSPPLREAILSIDDDVFVSCSTVAAMVGAFRQAPRQMVGLAPRLATRDRYLRWWHVWWNGRYTMVLSKVAVFHRDYLAAYFHPKLERLRRHVHEHRNCEDIAMSFIVANATKAPPVWLKAPYTDYGQSVYRSHAGISAQSGHIDIRTDCLALFTDIFGTFPLVTGDHKLVPATKEWFW